MFQQVLDVKSARNSNFQLFVSKKFVKLLEWKQTFAIFFAFREI